MPRDSNIAPPTLEVENLGPIRTANIELRPLTVLVGPSNTGKSYLAILIYALHRAIFNMWRSYPILWNRAELNKEIMDEAHNFINDLNAKIHSVDSKSIFDLDEDMASELIRIVHSNNARQLKFEILRSFGITNEQDLVRKNSKQKIAKVRLIQRNGRTDSKPLNTLISEKSSNCEVEVVGSRQIQLDFEEIKLERDLLQEQRGEVHDDRTQRAHVAREIFKGLVDPITNKAYYLPADRTGIMQTLMVVARSLIASASTEGLSARQNARMLSGVLADFLGEMIGMDEHVLLPKEWFASKSLKPAIDDVLERIETQLLNGEIVSRRTHATNYPVYHYRPTGWKTDLPMMQASSMVSELAPLVLYLQHLVCQKETLIIEEPESHLHPGMQVQLTELLTLLVRAGVRVIITTHSDWIISSLENIVLRDRSSSLSDNGAPIGDLDRDLEPRLSESDVGVWLFSKPSKGAGSKVKQLKFLDSGHYLPDFEKVLVELHNDWANQSSKLLNAR